MVTTREQTLALTSIRKNLALTTKKSYARFNLFSTREQALALPGIGKALADKIMEMVEVGRIRYQNGG